MSEWLEEGKKIPAVKLKSDSGDTISLKDYEGSPVVLYFYPKDDTPGCTKEACAFRDAKAEMQEFGAVVFGVSGDSVESHEKFRDKYDLNFPLLSDPGFKVSEKFGAYREKNMYGKKSMGIQRSTFLIGPDGKLVKVWKRVQVDGHDQQVLEAIRQLHG